MRTRLHHDPDAQPNMGDDRRTTVWVEFTPDEGMAASTVTTARHGPRLITSGTFRAAEEEFEQLRRCLELNPTTTHSTRSCAGLKAEL